MGGFASRLASHLRQRCLWTGLGTIVCRLARWMRPLKLSKVNSRALWPVLHGHRGWLIHAMTQNHHSKRGTGTTVRSLRPKQQPSVKLLHSAVLTQRRCVHQIAPCLLAAHADLLPGPGRILSPSHQPPSAERSKPQVSMIANAVPSWWTVCVLWPRCFVVASAAESVSLGYGQPSNCSRCVNSMCELHTSVCGRGVRELLCGLFRGDGCGGCVRRAAEEQPVRMHDHHARLKPQEQGRGRAKDHRC